MKFFKAIIILIIVIAIAAGLYLWYQKRTAPMPQPEMPPTPVPVAAPTIQDVVNYNDYTGNLASVESVDIRARVQGLLRQAAFEDGAYVKHGDLLFEIEPESYRADRDRAAAALRSAQADIERATQDYERVMQAVQSDAVSKQEVSTYKAQRDMAEAAVLSAKASLDQAELNLSYTRIESPLDGKISRNFVDEGNLVGAGENTLLANIVKLDPIYVYFNASESEYLDYMRNVRQEMADEPNQLPVYIRLANDEEYPLTGRLDYMDNRVDPETGTVQIRGVIPNPDHTLYPGMFVRIRVPSKMVRDAVLIPQAAIMSDLGGKYVLVVDENNILHRRDLKLGAVKNELQVVEAGLDGSEQFATGNFHFIRQGMPITPMTGDGPPPGAGGAAPQGQPGREPASEQP